MTLTSLILLTINSSYTESHHYCSLIVCLWCSEWNTHLGGSCCCSEFSSRPKNKYNWCEYCYKYNMLQLLLWCTISHLSFIILLFFQTLPIYLDYYSTLLTNMLTKSISPSFYHIPSAYLNNSTFLYKYHSESCTILSLFLPSNNNMSTLNTSTPQIL